MNDSLNFPLVPAGLVVVGMALLLAGPWPVGLPLLVAGTGELFVVLWCLAGD
ncbi:MAG: hypothetical protein QF685_10345 [Verrucomicrobiota bacterium]|jgi:hypothetical protein|nr:hypothetical protein [Verrucomicrobiota bacterium]